MARDLVDDCGFGFLMREAGCGFTRDARGAATDFEARGFDTAVPVVPFAPGEPDTVSVSSVLPTALRAVVEALRANVEMPTADVGARGSYFILLSAEMSASVEPADANGGWLLGVLGSPAGLSAVLSVVALRAEVEALSEEVDG